MSEKDIIQNMISRLGQSQDDRMPPELGRHFADVDERSGADLLAQARKLAGLMRFYPHDPAQPDGDWSSFFPPDDDAALLARDDGEVAPHLGLLAAFTGLYRYPQQVINTITGRHLDFQFRDVLRFEPKSAQPDHAHLLLELKKGASSAAVTPDHKFTAGKDAKGVELIYQPLRDTVIGNGKVEALYSVFHNSKGVFSTTIANSEDGLGGALDASLPKWRAFGSDRMHPAEIGFAISSPVLRMEGGERTVVIELALDNPSPGLQDKITSSFEMRVTGPKDWQEVEDIAATLGNGKLSLSFILPATAPAVADYNGAAHGQAFDASAPVVRIMLKADSGAQYGDLCSIMVKDAKITVTVEGLQSVTLENDDGSLNPKKSFLPFGPQPVTGSRFMIGCEEALSKYLAALSIDLSWQGAPSDLAAHYLNYQNAGQISNGISANLTYQDRREQPISVPIPNVLASSINGAPSLPLNKNDVRSGYITLSLTKDFLHADYRKESISNILEKKTVDVEGVKKPLVLNEPYTPKVQAISLSYTATSGSDNAQPGKGFTDPDMSFFHIGCFGQRPVQGERLPLLPAYDYEGEFFMGMSGVAAGDSISLLMQAAEDSGDPDLMPQKIEWSVLCSNDWRALTPRELILDSTNNLRASGIIAATLPGNASTSHTWMPAGHIWLRAAIKRDSAAACQLLAVAANAVEVRFADQGNDPSHLTRALPAGSITKLKTLLAAVKSVSQPYAGFGGSPLETDAMLTRRAAERLRHRNRCITPWDYERMLLEAFPKVHKVKCIPHASDSSWLAPGHVMLVVIPDLRNRNSSDRLQPRTDINTLSRMEEFAMRHCGMEVAVRAKNPHYQRVRLDFKVRFRPGSPFNYYCRQLQEALLCTLSPWAYDATRSIEFGGRIYRSVLLDFVEELSYVDFVTDFRMGFANEQGIILDDVAEISADRPDAILVSDYQHTISEAPDN